jgi:hypothetical protein
MIVRRRLLSAAAAVLVCAALWPRPPYPAAAAQLLLNGGFEEGAAGWSGAGLSTSGCPARSGAVALKMAPSGGLPLTATQQIPTAALGAYALTGFARLGSGGPASLQAGLVWLDSQGASIHEDSATLSLSTSYQAFTVTSSSAPPDAAALMVRLRAQGSGVACIDDVGLEGPPAATATPSPTFTPSPAPTETSSRTPTTPPATRTPRPPTATRVPSSTRAPAATKAATAGNAASSGRTAASPAGGALANGGFEDGLSPWQKFGGELVLASSPVHGGSSAGSLVSATASTKWAYQVVTVDGGGIYLFDGYLLADSGVSEAYLRISWYASADGSGTALSNTDSTEGITGGADAFAYLTTEGVEAPLSARSARARVMLAPAGNARAVLYMDDLSFGPSAMEPRDDSEEPATAEDAGGDRPAEDSQPSDANSSQPGSLNPAAPEEGRGPALQSRPRIATSVPAVLQAQDLGQTERNAGSPLAYVLLGALLTILSTAVTAWSVRRFSRRRQQVVP